MKNPFKNKLKHYDGSYYTDPFPAAIAIMVAIGLLIVSIILFLFWILNPLIN